MDIQMFGHIDVNCPKQIIHICSGFFLKYPVYLRKSWLEAPWVCMWTLSYPHTTNWLWWTLL